MIDKIKEMPRQQVIATVILICMLPLMSLWYKSRKEDKENSSVADVTIESNSSQYDSKLAAFKAKQRMEKESSSQHMLDSKQMERFMRVTQDETEDVGDNSKATKDEPAVADDKPIEVSNKPVKPKSHTNSATNNLRMAARIPSEAKPEATDKVIGNNDNDRDIRLQQMREGWGNKSSNRVEERGRSYKGVIHGTQELSGGQIANLRTREEIRINNIVIPANTLLSGNTRISQGRVMIDVSSVRLRNDIYSVSITVYGSDGLPGLPTSMSMVDNAINKEVTNEAISQVGRTGVIGNIASKVASTAVRDKNQKITLIDSQSIYFKVNERR